METLMAKAHGQGTSQHSKACTVHERCITTWCGSISGKLSHLGCRLASTPSLALQQSCEPLTFICTC